MRQMNFTKSELEMLYQYAAPTKEETLAGLKEIVPVLERKDDLLSKVIVENTIRKLEKLAEPECSRFIADNRARDFPAGRTEPGGTAAACPFLHQRYFCRRRYVCGFLYP